MVMVPGNMPVTQSRRVASPSAGSASALASQCCAPPKLPAMMPVTWYPCSFRLPVAKSVGTGKVAETAASGGPSELVRDQDGRRRTRLHRGARVPGGGGADREVVIDLGEVWPGAGGRRSRGRREILRHLVDLVHPGLVDEP